MQLLTIKEVAKIMRTSESSVRFWIGQGKLNSIKPGRLRLIHREDLERFVSSDGKLPGMPIRRGKNLMATHGKKARAEKGWGKKKAKKKKTKKARDK